MKAGQMIPSKFLKKDDCDQPKLVTIKSLRQSNVAQEDQPEELKWTMLFREFEKPLVMNSTNIQLTTIALGTDETDNWVGRQVVIYNDPNVSFGGKITGGIRIRAPKVRPGGQPPVTPAPAPVQQDNPPFEDDDIPF